MRSIYFVGLQLRCLSNLSLELHPPGSDHTEGEMDVQKIDVQKIVEKYKKLFVQALARSRQNLFLGHGVPPKVKIPDITSEGQVERQPLPQNASSAG